MTIQPHHRYTATIRLRRGNGYDVKPEYAHLDGIRATFYAAWNIGDERDIYRDTRRHPPPTRLGSDLA